MDLFDKKFVYFMWDDELEAREGFFADYIGDLEDYVNSNYTDYKGLKTS